MSREQFSDECQECRPAMIDLNTGEPLTDDHPVMIIVNEVWANSSLEERQAFHKVTCQNSRDRKDLGLVEGLIKRCTPTSPPLAS